MIRGSMRVLLAFCAVLAVALAGADAARACGMPLEAAIPSERALVVHADGREEIVVQLQLSAAGEERPAVVFPVPGDAEVDALADASVFEYLEEATRPRIEIVEREPSDEDGAVGGAAPTGGAGVDVIGREVVGGYDVTRLAAGDTSALLRYLARNGYELPAGAAPIVEEYIREGWRFVAIKLAADGPPGGALSPLRIAFDSERLVYPMRLDQLAEQGVTIDLYLAADHKQQIDRLQPQYAGRVADLSPPVPAGLREVLRAPYLTKLRGVRLAPASLTEDFVARRAPDDDPYRATLQQVRFVAASGPPWGAIATVLILGAIAGGGLLLILSRRRARRARERDGEESAPGPRA